jgi:hypothetical protein
MRSVIPGIFPLLFLSSLLAGELRNCSIPPLERVLHIPSGSAGFFLIGLLCGYPVGAKLLQNEIDRKCISTRNASRMITFCNNASPAFIVGVITPLLGNVWFALLLWLIQMIASIFTGVLLPGHRQEAVIHRSLQTSKPGTVMIESVKAIAMICGWIILFGILLAYMQPAFLHNLPPVTKTLLCGILELTNGIYVLRFICSPGIRFMVASILLSFGGLCILLQSKSVAPSMSIINFIAGRLLHAGISGTLTSFICLFLFPNDLAASCCFPQFLSILLLSFIILYFNKKMVAINENI